ncbi:MAG: hypothetical protein Q9227_001295 [Pyrenula ochraceoflavens]
MATSSALVVLILRMPLRDPELPKDDTSPTFGSTTSKLRSPEDDLTVWQFMTVSWMAPLISAGNSKQLADEDVWHLGYEFQHRNLHTRFRELQGSVLRRLLYANGIDLVIISLLGLIELVGSEFLRTQSEKIVGLRSREGSDTLIDGRPNDTKSNITRGRRIIDWLMKPFRRNRQNRPEKPKDAASMGKILNLMRFDAYEVAQR